MYFMPYGIFSSPAITDPQLLPSSSMDPEIDCPKSEGGGGTQAGLIVFIVLLLVLLSAAVGVAIWAIVMANKYKRLHSISFSEIN